MSSVKELLRGNVIDGTGTANYIPKFIDTTSVGSSNIYDSSGNIGIGTSGPSYKLEVNGDIKCDNITIGTTAEADSYIFLTSSTSGISQIRMGDSNTNAGAIAYDNGDDSMQFRANAAERMRIDSSGNIGIGTSSPIQLLHLKSAAPAIEFDDSNFATVRARISTDQGNIGIEADYNNSRNGSHIVLNVDGSTKARIDADGLKFGSDTAAANALDDYEEGEWDPKLYDYNTGTEIANATYNSTFHKASYTKIGRLVVVTGVFRLTNKGTVTSGNIAGIGNLPFATGSGTAQSHRASCLLVVNGSANSWELTGSNVNYGPIKNLAGSIVTLGSLATDYYVVSFSLTYYTNL